MFVCPKLYYHFLKDTCTHPLHPSFSLTFHLFFVLSSRPTKSAWSNQSDEDNDSDDEDQNDGKVSGRSVGGRLRDDNVNSSYT